MTATLKLKADDRRGVPSGSTEIGKKYRLYSMPVSDVLTFLISAVIIVKTHRELCTEV